VLAPLSWLRDFAPFSDDVEMLRSTLDDLGLVVESVERIGEGLGDIVVARIDEISAIDGADRVRRVVVDAGDGPLEIVCGATNFALGDLVPLAPVGAVLPGGFEIARRKMRGQVSNGMLCSSTELGLGDDHTGLLLLTDVPAASPGVGLVEVLGIEPDVVFDVTVEGNRPDAWSIRGIARDLAARLGLPFSDTRPVLPAVSDTPTTSLASAVIVDEDLCDRLEIAVLEDVVVGPSPTWIADRLSIAGMRPINNVVDASNYVMLELGQPTHPYDLDKISSRGLRIRRARPGESMMSLDGVERELGTAGRSLGDTGEDCVICDADDRVIGIAGIMGGASSEIDENTSTVLLEAASFDPIAITRTSRRLALRTEAAARFQKGTDPDGIGRAVDRFIELVALSCPAMSPAASPILLPAEVPPASTLLLPIQRVNELLGTELKTGDVEALLVPRGFAMTEMHPGELEVTIPSNRPDIRRSHHGLADLIEEIARTYGYSRLPRRDPAWPQPGRPSPRQLLRNEIRDVLVGLGVDEAWTATLVGSGELELLGIDEPEITVTNPLTSEESRLRRSLLPGLVRAVGYNLDRRQDDVALFEIGATFVHPSVVPQPRLARAGSAGGSEVAVASEPERLGVCLAGPDDDVRTALGVAQTIFSALRLSDVRVASAPPSDRSLAGLHPTRSAALVDTSSGTQIGVVGEIDPEMQSGLAPTARGQRIGYLELDLDALGDSQLATRRPLTAEPVSRFPSSDLDLAFALANEVSVDKLLDTIRAAVPDILESVRLFDVYRGEGVPDTVRSLALRCRLCAIDHTLSDEEISSARSAMIDAAGGLGATLR